MDIDRVLSYCLKRCDKWSAAVIGGAVRDELMGITPKDYDVFYFLGDDHAMRKGELIEAFAAEEKGKSKSFKRHSSLCADFLIDGEHSVQVVVSQYSNACELLDHVDFNVSAFSFDGRYDTREEISNIQSGKPLRLLEITSPISSLSRGFEFAKRFEMIFEAKDIARLCREVCGCVRPKRVRRRKFRPA